MIIIGAGWAVYEIVSAIADVYHAVETVLDPNATTTDKVVATLGAGFSVFGPGGGYGRAGKKALNEGLEYVNTTRRVSQGTGKIGVNLQLFAESGDIGSRAISPKIARQMGPRGWTGDNLDGVLSNPHTTRPAINKATGNPATAYFDVDGAYVVRDNITGEIIQVSNRNDPNWIPDSSIIDPYIPGK